MKRLTITYGDLVIHDGDVDEFNWSDTSGSVAVSGKIKRPNGGGGLLELLAAGRRQQSEPVSTPDSLSEEVHQ